MCERKTEIYIFHEPNDRTSPLYVQPHEILNTNSSGKRRTEKISACIKMVIVVCFGRPLVVDGVSIRFNCTHTRRINNKGRMEYSSGIENAFIRFSHTHAHMMTIQIFIFIPFRFWFFSLSLFVGCVCVWIVCAHTVLHIQVFLVCGPCNRCDAYSIRYRFRWFTSLTRRP